MGVEDKLDCLQIEDGVLSVVTGDLLECGSDGLKYSGVVTPVIAGHEGCVDRPVDGCGPIYKDPESKGVWAPECARTSTSTTTFSGNAALNDLIQGSSWSSPNFQVSAGPNSFCLQANIVYKICRNIVVVDPGDLTAFNVTDQWNNVDIPKIQKFYMDTNTPGGDVTILRVSYCRYQPVPPLLEGESALDDFSFRIDNLPENDSSIGIFGYDVTITRHLTYMEPCGFFPQGVC